MENQYLDSNLDNNTNKFVDYGSFGRRFVAALIDGLLVGIANELFMSMSGVSSKIQDIVAEDPTDISGIISAAGPAWALGFAIQLGYYAYFESSEKQATLGKQAMGLTVTDMNGDRITFGKAAIRFLAKIPSGLILGIGYFMQPFTEKRQALHDIISGTLVFKNRK
jgi:uncharacterized RDD family membrane protein YckC